jgi:hypothetical protein
VKPPRGEFWSAGTIHGNRARGSGLLSNALYDGRLVSNKVTMRKDPATGKRVSRVNPETEWQVTAVPHLRIIERETFAAAQARTGDRGHNAPAAVRKPGTCFRACSAAAPAAVRSSSRTGIPKVAASTAPACTRVAAAPTAGPSIWRTSNAACSPVWRSS